MEIKWFIWRTRSSFDIGKEYENKINAFFFWNKSWMENKYIDTLFKSVVIFYDNIINKIGNKKEIVSNYNNGKRNNWNSNGNNI